VSISYSLLRVFTVEGIEHFRRYIQHVKARQIIDSPDALIEDERLTQVIDADTYIEFYPFPTALDMAIYLHPIIKQLQLPDKFYNPGLYSWLSAFYFDVVCPIEKGIRKPGEETRYIPSLDRNFRRDYRHLIAAPLRMFDAHGVERTRLLLYLAPYKRSEFLREIMETQELAMNSGVLEAITLLYWDDQKNLPKVGSVTKQKPGTLRRFVAVMNQFNLTYDLHAMSGQQIVSLLPKREFNRWLTR